MRLKKPVRRIHLWIGLTAGIIIFIVGITGTLLAFRDELEPLIYHKELFVAHVQEQRMPMDKLMHIARQRLPRDSITKISLYAAADRTVLFRMQADKAGSPRMLISIDPYSGKILKVRHYDRWFFEAVKQIHRYLLMGTFGKAITGIACAFFLIMLISGMVLWWPVSKKTTRQRFKMKLTASAKRRNWDLHAVLGFYSSPFLLIIALTGLIMSYKWVGEAISFVVDGKVPSEKVTHTVSSQNIGSAPFLYEQMLDTTNKIFPYYGKITIIPPSKKRKEVSIYKVNAEAGAQGISSSISFDPLTGKTIAIKPFEKASPSVHTGEIFGWPTKILAFLLGLCAASFPVTGFCIWWRKKNKKYTKIRHRQLANKSSEKQLV